MLVVLFFLVNCDEVIKQMTENESKLGESMKPYIEKGVRSKSNPLRGGTSFFFFLGVGGWRGNHLTLWSMNTQNIFGIDAFIPDEEDVIGNRDFLSSYFYDGKREDEIFKKSVR